MFSFYLSSCKKTGTAGTVGTAGTAGTVGTVGTVGFGTVGLVGFSYGKPEINQSRKNITILALICFISFCAPFVLMKLNKC